MIARQLEMLVARKRAEVRRRGAPALLEVLRPDQPHLTRSRAVRRLLEQERATAMRMLTSSAGVVQPRACRRVQALIEEEVASGRYHPPADPATLAYAIVRLADAFLYQRPAVGIRGDHERLREVQAALLGVPRASARGERSAIAARGTARAAPPVDAKAAASLLPRPCPAVGSPGPRLARRLARTRPTAPPAASRTAARARTPPWIPLGQTSIAAISTMP